MSNKPYDPKPTKYKFPKYTDGHYLVVKKNDHAKFDKDFPYIDKSKKFQRRFKAFRILVVGLAMPVMAVRVLLKVEGRKNIKKHKELLKQGVVSISNHVHIWDYIAVMDAIRPFIPYHPSWATNCRGENKTLIRYTGGVPVPEGDIRASYHFTKAIEEHIANGGWFHTYAEGSMWESYQPIRPFKKGAFRWAVKTGKPILPLAFSYRKPKGLVKLIWGKNAPLLTLRIGEPIFPDMTIPTPQAIEKLTIEAHQAVCRLAGIEPSENIYPPVYENTLRIDYYDNPNAEPLDEQTDGQDEQN